jgi:hypothetical protein
MLGGNAFLPAQIKRHLTEHILSHTGQQANLGSKSSGGYRLVGSLASRPHIEGIPDQSFSKNRHARNPDRKPDDKASDDKYVGHS